MLRMLARCCSSTKHKPFVERFWRRKKNICIFHSFNANKQNIRHNKMEIIWKKKIKKIGSEKWQYERKKSASVIIVVHSASCIILSVYIYSAMQCTHRSQQCHPDLHAAICVARDAVAIIAGEWVHQELRHKRSSYHYASNSPLSLARVTSNQIYICRSFVLGVRTVHAAIFIQCEMNTYHNKCK